MPSASAVGGAPPLGPGERLQAMYCFACCSPWDRPAAHSRCTVGRVGSCEKRISPQLPSVGSFCGPLPVYSGRVGSCKKRTSSHLPSVGSPCGPLLVYRWPGGQLQETYFFATALREIALRLTPGVQFVWVVAPPTAQARWEAVPPCAAGELEIFILLLAVVIFCF